MPDTLAPSRTLDRLREAWRTLSFRAVLLLWAALVILSFKRAPSPLFSWDSFGYHLYLPATVIHHDPFLKDLSWVEQARTELGASGTLYQVSTLDDGTRLIKYPMGLALLWAPFFAIGHAIAWMTGQPMDGYGPAYQWSVIAGMLAFLLVGLLSLRGVLRSAFSDRTTTIVIVLLGLGTNLLDQATAGMAMPHLPLFCLYALMLRRIDRWKEDGSWRAVAGYGLCAGLAMLARPSEAVCLLLPLFWSAKPSSRQASLPIGRRAAQWVTVLGILGLIGSMQFLYWHAATGHWFVDTYNNAGEGFDLGSPHTIPFLFGFRKGWYIYTPIMLLATVGLVFLRRFWPAAFFPVLIHVIANLYLVSSWTCWWYADSFGSRAMVGSYAVMALPLAALVARIQEMRWMTRAFWAAVLAALAGLNLFQHWQYDRGIIDPSRMTFAAWRATLGERSRPADLEDRLLVRRSTTTDDVGPDPERYAARILPARFTTPPSSPRDTVHTDSLTGQERHVFRIDRDHPYTPAIRIPYRVLTSSDHAWIEATWRLTPSRTPVRGAIVRHFEHGGRTYFYRTHDLTASDLATGGTSTVRSWYLTPEVRDKNDLFVVYYWSQDTIPVEVEGPFLTIHEPIDLP